MTSQRIYTDEEIIAYLDQTLEGRDQRSIERALINDVELQDRVAALTIDTNELRDSFDLLLQNVPPIDLSAPSDNLQTGSHSSSDNHNTSRLNRTAKRPARKQQQSNHWVSWVAAASLVVAVAVGSYFAGLRSQDDRSQINDWRVAVADYQRLYVPETLPPDSPDPAARKRQLDRVSALGGFTLTNAMLELPNLEFRRAQALGIVDQPLTQLVFAANNGEPVALCMTPDSGDVESPATSRIYDMNMVSWRKNDMGFVLMGRVSEEILNETAVKAFAIY